MAESTPSRLLPIDSARLIGQQLGDFTVERHIGSGGMGEVFLAHQISLRRHVALKILRPDLARDINYLKRFETEAKAIAPIHHPNIVAVHAIGEHEGIHYIAFEYVRGVNLRQYIDRQGPIDESTALQIAIKVASALVDAHDAGIVHRDIKPENILITRRGEVKVADFGLAKQIGTEDVRLTQTGMTMGTPLYMSPEQIQGGDVDVRSDIYSLGIVCYHMLIGEPPFRGETAVAVAIQHIHGNVPPIEEARPDVSPAFLRVIHRMLAKSPAKRYAMPAELLADLQRLQKGEGHLIPRMPGWTQPGTSWTPRLARWAKPFRSLTRSVTLAAQGPRRGWLIALSLLVATGGGALVAAAWRFWTPSHLPQAVQGAPDVSTVAKFNDGAIQFSHARDVLKGPEQELGFWAVLVHYKWDDDSTLLAAQQLADTYLASRRYSELDRLARYLMERENPDQQTYAYLLQGIALSRSGEAPSADQAFQNMIETGKQAEMDAEAREWLARHYLLCAAQNDELLARSPEDSQAQRVLFWEVFGQRRRRDRPGMGPEGPGDRPPPPVRSTNR